MRIQIILGDLLKILISILLLSSSSFGSSSKNYDCIDIDASKVVITSSSCTSNSGSIKGLIISNGQYYSWRDLEGNIVSTNRDLINVKAGEYQLTATNDDGCISISKLFLIESIGTLPTYHVYGIAAACGKDNGSLHIEIEESQDLPTGIRWTNSANETIGTDKSIFDLKEGRYNLYLKNSAGCEVAYRTINLTRIFAIEIDLSEVKIKDDICSQGQGSVTNILVKNGLVPTFEWKNNNGEVISRDRELLNIKSGVYNLTVSDACAETLYQKEFVVENVTIDQNKPLIDDFRLCVPSKVRIDIKNPQIGIYKIYDNEHSIVPIFENSNPWFDIDIKGEQTYYVSYSLGFCESERTKVNIGVGVTNAVIPNTITPNGDGINDYWNLSWLLQYASPKVIIYNRLGEVVYNFQKTKMLFDGQFNGKDLPVGTYYYLLHPQKDCVQITGTINIIR